MEKYSDIIQTDEEIMTKVNYLFSIYKETFLISICNWIKNKFSILYQQYIILISLNLVEILISLNLVEILILYDFKQNF